MLQAERDSAHLRRSVRIALVGEAVTDSIAPWSGALEASLVSAAATGSCEEILGKGQYVF
jgi:hypothetical protein